MCFILILFLWQNICRTACTLLLLSIFSLPLAAWVLTVDHLAERIRSRLAVKTKQDYLGKMAANASHASNDEFRSSRSRWMNKAFSSKHLIIFFFLPPPPSHVLSITNGTLTPMRSRQCVQTIAAQGTMRYDFLHGLNFTTGNWIRVPVSTSKIFRRLERVMLAQLRSLLFEWNQWGKQAKPPVWTRSSNRAWSVRRRKYTSQTLTDEAAARREAMTARVR